METNVLFLIFAVFALLLFMGGKSSFSSIFKGGSTHHCDSNSGVCKV